MTVNPFGSFPSNLTKVIDMLKNFPPVYLVGGAVRDLFLEVPTHDLDFILKGNVRNIARKVADDLGGSFFMLDPNRQTARVIYHTEDNYVYYLDFAEMRGNSIQEDLKERDFTINAMAIEVNSPEIVFDPLNGKQDLQGKILRECSAGSLHNDPIRVIRAIRLALSYGLNIEKCTISSMKDACPKLSMVSSERKRDEIVRILSGKKVYKAIKLMDHFGVMDETLRYISNLKNHKLSNHGGIDSFEYSLSLIRELEYVTDVITGDYEKNDVEYFTTAELVLKLNKFRTDFHDHINSCYVINRPLRVLLIIAALYSVKNSVDHQTPVEGINTESDIHWDRPEQVNQFLMQQLSISSAESRKVTNIIFGCQKYQENFNSKIIPSRRMLYRYFKPIGVAGLDAAMVNLAGFLANKQDINLQSSWETEVELFRLIAETWWENRDQIITPPRIINGEEIINRFGLGSGPLIGSILNSLEEEQASGEITRKEDAYDFIHQLIKDRGKLN